MLILVSLCFSDEYLLYFPLSAKARLTAFSKELHLRRDEIFKKFAALRAVVAAEAAVMMSWVTVRLGLVFNSGHRLKHLTAPCFQFPGKRKAVNILISKCLMSYSSK